MLFRNPAISLNPLVPDPTDSGMKSRNDQPSLPLAISASSL
jgi:hypothetical protein